METARIPVGIDRRFETGEQSRLETPHAHVLDTQGVDRPLKHVRFVWRHAQSERS